MLINKIANKTISKWGQNAIFSASIPFAKEILKDSGAKLSFVKFMI